ncbi:MAG: hypothetical protein MUC87_00605 [Bacteroidia bacterium]|jgi:hypothetical protein|nr:hypothetical protein [Bacteroidia bacterium]
MKDQKFPYFGLLPICEEKRKIQILKKAIEQGKVSGISDDFDPIKHLEFLKGRHK